MIPKDASPDNPKSPSPSPETPDYGSLVGSVSASPTRWVMLPEQWRQGVAKCAALAYQGDDDPDGDPARALALSWTSPGSRKAILDHLPDFTSRRQTDTLARMLTEKYTSMRETYEYLPAVDSDGYAIYPETVQGGVEASQLDTTPPQWLWYPLIPRDALTLIVGQPSTGKTALAVWVAAAITRGDALPNFTSYPSPVVRSDPARVAWYDAESTGPAFRRRLEAAGADLDLVRYFGPELERTLSDVETIRVDLGRMPSPPALVVFDTMAGFLPARQDLENMAHARRLLRPLSALAAETGTAFALLHHEGKGQRTNAMHVGVGSIGIMGAARSALVCAEHPDEEGRFVAMHAKSSEEQRANGNAYRLLRHELAPGAASVKLTWDGRVDLDIMEVINPAKAKADGAAMAEAKEFLKDSLSKGPELASELIRTWADGGGSKATLQRAATALEITKRRRSDPDKAWSSRPFEWELPSDVPF